MVDAILVDRRLRLKRIPAFLTGIGGHERGLQAAIAFILVCVFTFVSGMLGYLVAGFANIALTRILTGVDLPVGPDPVAAALRSVAECGGCLFGGLTRTVVVGIVSGACLSGVLIALRFAHGRSALSWLTSAPRFRWRLFLAGLGLFGTVIGAAASLPEAVHGWPDRPVFLKSGETPAVQAAYVAVVLVALPVAAAFEEVLCRGWLLQTTGAFTVSLPPILFLNSLVFALLHADPDPGRNLSRLILGMVLSWGALRTGGLEIGIGIHAANNLVILLLAQTLEQSDRPTGSDPLAFAINIGVSLAALAVIEAVARWDPLRRACGLSGPDDQSASERAKSTRAAP